MLAVRGAVRDEIKSLKSPEGNWLGPEQPVNAVFDDADPRQWDYPAGYNINWTPRKYEPYSFQELQWLADNFDLLREVIERRKGELIKLDWGIGARGEEEADEDEVAEVKEFLRFPDRNLARPWPLWLRTVLEDRLVCDCATVYPHPTKSGGVYSFDIISGHTVNPLIDELGRIPDPPDPAYQQVIRGIVYENFTKNELIYAPFNVRPYTPIYGFSPVQQLVLTISIALRLQQRDNYYYQFGTIPDALIGVPDKWTGKEIARFQAWFDDTFSGNLRKRSGGAVFVPGAMKEVAIKDYKFTKDQWEWLARVICAAYHVSPQPYTGQVNRATAETAQVEQTEEGLEPDKIWIKALFDTMLIYMGKSHLELVWTENTDIDPQEQATSDKLQVESGVRTVNEIRVRDGLEPQEGGDDAFVLAGNQILRLKDIEANADMAAQTAAATLEVTKNPPAPAAPAVGTRANGAGASKQGAPKRKPAAAGSGGAGKTKKAYSEDQPRDERGRWEGGAASEETAAKEHTLSAGNARAMGDLNTAGRHEMAAFRHQTAANNYRNALSGREHEGPMGDRNARDAKNYDEQYGLGMHAKVAGSRVYRMGKYVVPTDIL